MYRSAWVPGQHWRQLTWLMALTLVAVLVPTAARADASLVADAGGYHACTIDDGALGCWGRNDRGQADGSVDVAVPAPRPAADFGPVKAVALGAYHSCVLQTAGSVRCWGAGSHGQLGDGATPYRAGPVTVGGLDDVTSLAAGQFHSCAAHRSGTVSCWGSNYSGELGDGTTQQRTTPVRVADLDDATSVSGGGVYYGGNFTCALRVSATVSCWGDNDTGQLGAGDASDRSAPVDVVGLTGVTKVDAGGYHACALRDDGSVWCWGDNYYGQIGRPVAHTWVVPYGLGRSLGMTHSTRPVKVPGIVDAVDVAAGGYHSCALRRSGDLLCWGNNDYGQLNRAGDASATPTPAASGVRSVTAGEGFTCATTATVSCWGRDDWGQRGDG